MPRRRRTPDTPQGFYEAALSEAERVRLSGARRLEGLDEEIALLRLRLVKALEEHPQDLRLFLQGMTLLMRLVATRYRMEPGRQKLLGEKVAEVIRQVGEQLWPEEYRNAS